MTARMRGTRSFRFWYDTRDPYYRVMIDEMKRARDNGYSVIEIARILDQRSCRNLYALFRKEGMLPKLPWKHQKTPVLPELFKTALAEWGLSFLQWCNAHALNPAITEVCLQEPEVKDEPFSEAAHRAIRQDFPQLYPVLYEGSMYQPPVVPEEPDWHYRHPVHILCDPEIGSYQASVPELPGCAFEGKTFNAASYGLRRRYVVHVNIVKLRLLPPREFNPDYAPGGDPQVDKTHVSDCA